MHKTKIEIGDWSGDGHGKSESFLIESNFNRAQIVAAYDKGKEIIGLEKSVRVYVGGAPPNHYEERTMFKGIDDFCEEYEDNTLPEHYIHLLGMHGVLDVVNDKGELFDGYCCYSDQFVEIYLGTAKLGDPAFQYKIVSDNVPSIDIGGYGLDFSKSG